MITTPSKLPVEVWNVGIDFGAQLATGETISSAGVCAQAATALTTSVTNNGMTAAYQSISGSIVTVQLSGGTSGQRALFEVGAVTSTGETLAETVQVPLC